MGGGGGGVGNGEESVARGRFGGDGGWFVSSGVGGILGGEGEGAKEREGGGPEKREGICGSCFRAITDETAGVATDTGNKVKIKRIYRFIVKILRNKVVVFCFNCYHRYV